MFFLSDRTLLRLFVIQRIESESQLYLLPLVSCQKVFLTVILGKVRTHCSCTGRAQTQVPSFPVQVRVLFTFPPSPLDLKSSPSPRGHTMSETAAVC